MGTACSCPPGQCKCTNCPGKQSLSDSSCACTSSGSCSCDKDNCKCDNCKCDKCGNSTEPAQTAPQSRPRPPPLDRSFFHASPARTTLPSRLCLTSDPKWRHTLLRCDHHFASSLALLFSFKNGPEAH